jgi:Family of unknown function (DUF6297)
VTALPDELVPVDQVLAFLRRSRVRHRRPDYRSDRLIAAYTAVLYGSIVGGTVFQTLRTSSATPDETAATLAGLGRWGPAVVILGLTAMLRWATWHGPVVFTPPDVHWLFSAPLSHPALLRVRLRRALILGALLGGFLGLVLFILIKPDLDVAIVPLLATALGSAAALGLLAVALGWLVECSVERAQRTLRLSPLSIPLAAGLIWLGGLGTGVVGFWSGPWGWAVGPVVAAGGGRVPGWPLQLALLLLAMLVSLVLAWRNAADVPTEELARRAGLHTGLVANLYFVDLRGVSVQRREAERGLLGLRAVRVRRPRIRWLALPWRDAVSLLRAPASMGWALILLGGGALAVAASPDKPAFSIGAILAGYFAAAQLVEPVRVEADQPSAHFLLPWRWGEVVLRHTALPTLVLTVIAAVVVALAWLLGLVPTAIAWRALVTCPMVAGVLVLTAAAVGQRGRFPIELLLLGGEFGGLLLLLWLITGPLLTSLILGIPAQLLRRAVQSGQPLDSALGQVELLLLLVVAVEIVFVRSRKPPA